MHTFARTTTAVKAPKMEARVVMHPFIPTSVVCRSCECGVWWWPGMGEGEASFGFVVVKSRLACTHRLGNALSWNSCRLCRHVRGSVTTDGRRPRVAIG